MTDQTAPPDEDAGSREASLQRLATALMGYPDLDATVQLDAPAPCVAVRNTSAPRLSETVGVRRLGGGLAYVWSWGEMIGGASDPDSAARAIAYVLQARGAHLGT